MEKNIDYILNSNNFEELFNNTYTLMLDLYEKGNMTELRSLRKKISKLDKDFFAVQSQVYLCDLLDMQIALLSQVNKDVHIRESVYQKEVCQNFSKYFPNYMFVQCEYTIPTIGIIDIFATCKTDNRPVAIELKTKNNNPTKQLIAYGTAFTNPILIGITEIKLDPKLKSSQIQYYTYDILNIHPSA